MRLKKNKKQFRNLIFNFKNTSGLNSSRKFKDDSKIKKYKNLKSIDKIYFKLNSVNCFSENYPKKTQHKNTFISKVYQHPNLKDNKLSFYSCRLIKKNIKKKIDLKKKKNLFLKNSENSKLTRKKTFQNSGRKILSSIKFSKFIGKIKKSKDIKNLKNKTNKTTLSLKNNLLRNNNLQNNRLDILKNIYKIKKSSFNFY